MTMLPRGRSARLPLLAAVTAVTLVGLASGRLYADPPTLQLKFSDQPNDPNPQELVLRPTLQQQLFVYVQNNSGDPQDVTVEVLAGGVPVAATAKPLTAKPNGKATPVDFSKPAAPDQPAPPAPPVPKPPVPAPPALEEAKGSLVIHMVDKDHKEVGEPQTLEVTPPSQYIDFLSASAFTPAATWSGRNKLTVKVKTKGTFLGAACRVELVLSPDRIPVLNESARKEGSRVGYLASPRRPTKKDDNIAPNELTLTAENLDLRPAKPGESRSGLVYLTIDGWERAYTLQTTFPTSGSPTTLESITQPIVRLIASPFADPAAPYPVRIEADNIGARLLELGLDRDGDAKFEEANNEIVKFSQYPPENGDVVKSTGGDRKIHMLFSPAGPGGSLLLQPQVEDWKTALDVTGIDGPRDLRVRLLAYDDTEKKFAETPFYGARPAEFGQPVKPVEPLGSLDKSLLFTIQLNGSAPQGVQLYFPDKPIKRGGPLKVQATTTDKPDEIKDVFFYIGKPGPDGKPPANVETVKGERHQLDQEVVWAADLPAATDTKGTMPVTAEFVKFNNLAKNGTATVTLEEAPAAAGAAAAAAKPGSIEGVVVEGGRGQPGLEVRLLDDKGAVKNATSTDPTGRYVFKDVAAGSYRVTSAKTTDSTKGETAVQVLDDKKAVGDIKLTR